MISDDRYLNGANKETDLKYKMSKLGYGMAGHEGRPMKAQTSVNTRGNE